MLSQIVRLSCTRLAHPPRAGMALAKPLLTRSIVLPATRCFSAAGTTGRVQGTMALAKPLLPRSIVLPATRCFSAAGTTGRVQGTKNATFATATGTVNEGTPPPENFAAKVRKVIPLYIISHSSNIVRGIGLVMPDMLILQSCMFFASTTNAAFNLLQPKPLYTPAIYGLLFALVSATIVAKILKERFVWLDPEEEAIFNEHFKEFMPMPKFKKLIDHGTKHPTWSEDALASSTVIAPGKPPNLVLLVAGKANVNAHDAAQANVTTIERGPGILGEKVCNSGVGCL